MPRLHRSQKAWFLNRYRRFHNRPAFVPSDPTDEESPLIAGNAKTSKERRGNKTDLLRPAYPSVFRKFGNNTRARVYPLPNTGILDNKYEKGFFDSRQGDASLIAQKAALGQGGSTADLLSSVPALAAGAHHWLFSTGGGKHGAGRRA